MKMVLIIMAGVVIIGAGIALFNMRGALATGVQTPASATKGTLWTQQTHTLAGKATSLEPWQGKVVLVVNVASKCGLTPQYKGLESLYQELKDEGFVILAFPSNDFMGQEPGTAEEIRAFCDANYQVSFPMFEKMPVKGASKSELYQFLTAGGLEEPSWNFTKYLVGRDGKVVARFAPRTAPDDAALREAIDNTLSN